jgi:hypothetical protein
VRRAAAHVVPFDGARCVALLARAEFFEVVGRRHAAHVEEVFVLANAACARFIGLALGRDAVDRHFRSVHRQRLQHANLRAELIHQIHVRIKAQVARVLDHPVGRFAAAARGEFVASVEVRTVFGIGPARPQQHVPMFERIEAAALTTPAARIHCADLVFGRVLFFPVIGRRRVIPVHGRHVIAVRAVFRSQLPVAFIRVRRRTAQHFESVFRLVDDHVDDARRFAQIFGKRLHIGIQAAEQKAAIVFEARDFLQIMRALVIETLGITRFLRVFHLQQLAAVVEGPAVERAGERRLVAALVAAQHRAAMRARIDERVEFALTVARDDHGLAAHRRREVIVVRRNLAFVREIDPVALEDVLHLEFEQRFIREGAAMQAVVAARRVFDQIVVDVLELRTAVRIDGDHRMSPATGLLSRSPIRLNPKGIICGALRLCEE